MSVISETAQPVFRALSDPTRRAIIELLAERPRSIGEVVSVFDVTRTAIVKHLAILAEGGVIDVEHRGRERINILRPQTLQAAFDWLRYFDRFWDDRLEKLKSVVEKTK